MKASGPASGPPLTCSTQARVKPQRFAVKVTDKLTLNLGLRYDLETPRTERYNRMSYVNPEDPSPVKAPGFGDRRKALLEDIAVLSKRKEPLKQLAFFLTQRQN